MTTRAEKSLTTYELVTVAIYLLGGERRWVDTEDVAVKKIQKASSRFHARYSATKKIYLYQVKLGRMPAPLERRRIYSYYYSLNLKKIKKAARLIRGKHDFKSFQAKSSAKEMSTVRNLSKIQTFKKNDQLFFLFEGNGFLYNMVRAIAGSLMEVGRGKVAPAWLKEVLDSRDRRRAGPTAPASGLCLERGLYDT